MRRYVVLVLSAFVLSLLLAANITAGQRGVRVTASSGKSLYLYKDYRALIVGVGDYTNGWPDLPGAVKDAKEVASELKAQGFSVKLVINPASQELKDVLDDLAFEWGGEANRALLFYFAGHGETLDLADGTQLGYIIPADCPLKSRDPRGFDRKAVSMKEIEALALKVKSIHFLSLFDSCFSGSLFSLVRAAPTDITEKSARPVRQFITAGEAGEQVPDRSVFKTVFLQGIKGDADLNRDGFVTGSELGMHLQERVVNYSRGGQHPQYGKINNPKLDRGDFIFALKRPQETQAPEITARPSAKLLRLSFGANGTVVHIAAREGDSVEKGQEIARLDPEIHKVLHEQAQAEFLKGRAEARQAEIAYTRTSELHRRQVASTSSLEEARARKEKADAALKSLESKLKLAELRLKGTRLTAPVAGRIEKLDIEVGERVVEGKTVLLLAPSTGRAPDEKGVSTGAIPQRKGEQNKPKAVPW